MTTAVQATPNQRPWWLTLISGVLGLLGIIFGIALMANYYVVGMGPSMLWTAAVFAFVGGFFMIFRTFQQRSA